jgi:hypothetical protein
MLASMTRFLLMLVFWGVLGLSAASAQSLSAFTGGFAVVIDPSTLRNGQTLASLPLDNRIEISSRAVAGGGYSPGSMIIRGVELGLPNHGYHTIGERTRETQFGLLNVTNREASDRSQRFTRYALPTNDNLPPDLMGWAVVRVDQLVVGTVQISANGVAIMRQLDIGLAKPSAETGKLERPMRFREWRNGEQTIDVLGELQ